MSTLLVMEYESARGNYMESTTIVGSIMFRWRALQAERPGWSVYQRMNVRMLTMPYVKGM